MFLEMGGATRFKVQTKPTVSDRYLPKKTEGKAILYEKYYLHLLTIQLSIVDNVIDFNMLHLTGNT